MQERDGTLRPLLTRSVPTGGSYAGVLLLLVVLIGGSALAASQVYVSVNAGGSDLKVKPRKIHLLSNENLSGVHWTTWGGKAATGTGTDHGNAPSPGHKASNPVDVRATDRRQCGNKTVYTTIRLHYTLGVPYAGQPSNIKYAYGCPRG